MYYAIETRFVGATDYRGSRISARWRGNSTSRVMMPYDHALTSEGNHRKAARQLLEREPWAYEITAVGATDTGYVFVVGNPTIKTGPQSPDEVLS